jgi:hypothetical protein
MDVSYEDEDHGPKEGAQNDGVVGERRKADGCPT